MPSLYEPYLGAIISSTRPGPVPINQTLSLADGHLYPLNEQNLLRYSMLQTQPIASCSSSNFQSLFNAALKEYEKKTKKDLLAHPLAAQLQSCYSITAILTTLQDQVQQFDQRRRGDERLTKWLNPTVNVLYAFSATLGEGVGLVNFW
jgi:DUF438 domain-containing protein